MADVKWIKISINMFDDEKVKIIQAMNKGDSILMIWIRLIILAGKVNSGGYLYVNENLPYDNKMLATILNKPLKLIELAIKIFLDLEMIEMTDKGMFITNFEKYQNIDGLEKIKEQNRIRKQKQRDKMKNECVTENATSRDSHVTVTQQNKNKKENKNIENIIRVYEEEIGHATSFSFSVLDSYLDDLQEEMIIKAIQIASSNNKKSLNYIEGILKSWISKGYKVLADIENEKCKNNIDDTEKRVMEALYGRQGTN